MEKKCFDQPVTNDQRTYDNIRKLKQVKKMITNAINYWIMFILKVIIRW